MAKPNLTGKDAEALANHPLGQIIFLRRGAYCNLNDIAKLSGKRVQNWMRLKGTKELLQAFRDDPAYGGAEPIRTVVGGGGSIQQGTFAHPKIAQEFEKWCQKKIQKPEQVYLVWAVGSNMFKIGIAKHPFSRVKSMQIGSPLKLIVSRSHRCSDPVLLEKKLHEVFKSHFSHGEWFEIESDKACKLFDKTISKWTVTSINQK